MANMTDQPHPHRHLPRPLRIVRARPRLFIAALIGLAVVALCPSDWRIATRLLAGWDVGVGLYLALALRMMGVADLRPIKIPPRAPGERAINHPALAAPPAVARLPGVLCLLRRF